MNEDKVYFTQRLIAYILDMIIIVLISFLVTIPFTNDNVTKLNNELIEVTEKFSNNEIDTSTYMNQTKDLSFEIARQEGISNVINIFIIVCYFIIFQVYKGGQTIGKKIMKIKIVKDDNSDLTMNDLIIRNMLNNFILVDIITAVVTLINKDVYYYTTGTIQIIQIAYTFICIAMICIRKDGRSLSDIIAKTKVIRAE